MGRSVAVVGAGGIGFDVAEFLAHEADATPLAVDRPNAMPTVDAFLSEHGIDPANAARGGLLPKSAGAAAAGAGAGAGAAAGAGAGAGAGAAGEAPGAAAAAEARAETARQIYLLQRKSGKHGAGLGRTTGWIHRASLKKHGVHMLGGVRYDAVDDSGLRISQKGNPKRGVAPSETTLEVHPLRPRVVSTYLHTSRARAAE